MGPALRVETRRVDELDPSERALWARFRDADPALSSPYFDLRYVAAAAQFAPGAALAIIWRGEQIEAFLPFQRRGAMIQPLGAPLTDYHGLIARPGVAIDMRWVVETLGARRFRFGGLLGVSSEGVAAADAKPAMIADLRGGYEAYLAGRKAAGQGSYLKDKRRRMRQLTEALGAPVFRWSEDPADLDRIIADKAEQMRRTGQHNVFATDWTGDLLRRLASERQESFGVRVAVLEVGGRQIAAEAGLLSGEAYHLWFPTYNAEFSRFSPGALLTFETLRALADEGVAYADFGPGAEDYKRAFADPGRLVIEGDITADPFMEGLRAVVRQTVSASPRLHERLRDIYIRLDRRLDRITACEPRLEGQISAAGRSLGAIGRRHSRVSLGLGLSIAGASAGLLLLD